MLVYQRVYNRKNNEFFPMDLGVHMGNVVKNNHKPSPKSQPFPNGWFILIVLTVLTCFNHITLFSDKPTWIKKNVYSNPSPGNVPLSLGNPSTGRQVRLTPTHRGKPVPPKKATRSGGAGMEVFGGIVQKIEGSLEISSKSWDFSTKRTWKFKQKDHQRALCQHKKAGYPWISGI